MSDQEILPILRALKNSDLTDLANCEMLFVPYNRAKGNRWA